LRPEARITHPTGNGGNADPEAILEDVAARLVRLEERLDQLDRFDLGGRSRGSHVLFLSTVSGYQIVERDGPAPRVGEEIVVAGKSYRVDGSRRSPFPGDHRPCVTAGVAEQDHP
jgi:hypothetical protein